jgi:hypothetical protein
MSTNVNIGFGSSGLVERIKGQQRNARTDRMLRERLLTDATKAAIAKLTAPGAAPIDTYTAAANYSYPSASRNPNTGFLLVCNFNSIPDDHFNVVIGRPGYGEIPLMGKVMLHPLFTTYTWAFLPRGMTWARFTKSVPFESVTKALRYPLYMEPQYSMGIFRPRRGERYSVRFESVDRYDSIFHYYNEAVLVAGFVGIPQYYITFFSGPAGESITVDNVQWGVTNTAPGSSDLYPPDYIP